MITDPASLTDAMAGENFPVALAVLPRPIRADLVAAYRFARYVDDLGDEAPGGRVPQLERVRAEVHRLYETGNPEDEVVAGLGGLVARTGMPIGVWLRLVEANLIDQRVARYETFDDLLEYCRLSANPVGEIVLHIFGCATPDRIAFSDRICTALQLLEHWQDVGEDYSRGRIYVPQRDLRRFKVAETLLDSPVATEELRALIAFETDRALAWLDAGAPLVSTLSGWPRLAVSGYIAGGRAAASLLRRSGHDPMRTRKPSGWDVARAWLEATVRWPG
ncbi:MAG TPA: squalene synthase HpnC [Gemmatimonadales bacterium]|nr:squalene synthase HpnC [Gemmatimonadales bacterium]